MERALYHLTVHHLARHSPHVELKFCCSTQCFFRWHVDNHEVSHVLFGDNDQRARNQWWEMFSKWWHTSVSCFFKPPEEMLLLGFCPRAACSFSLCTRFSRFFWSKPIFPPVNSPALISLSVEDMGGRLSFTCYASPFASQIQKDSPFWIPCRLNRSINLRFSNLRTQVPLAPYSAMLWSLPKRV